MRWLLWVWAAVPAYGQVEFGVAGGVPARDFVRDSFAGSRGGAAVVQSAARRYTVGPLARLRVAGPVWFESGFLYKRFGLDTAVSSFGFLGSVSSNSSTRGNSWEVPVLATVPFRLTSQVDFFLSAGPSFRFLTGVREKGVRTSIVRPDPFSPAVTRTERYQTSDPADFNRRTSAGLTLGTGLRMRTGRLVWSPGIRFTYWDSERTSNGPAAPRLERSQLDALLAVAFAKGGERPAARLGCCVEFGILGGLALAPRLVQPPGPGFELDAPFVRWTAGALIEWRFRDRWSVEASALTRPFGHTFRQNQPRFEFGTRGYVFEAPLLVKWRPREFGRAGLVTGLGPALRRGVQSQRFGYRGESALGLAATAGLEWRTGPVRLRPELRFTWFGRPLYDAFVVVPRQYGLAMTLALTWGPRMRR